MMKALALVGSIVTSAGFQWDHIIFTPERWVMGCKANHSAPDLSKYGVVTVGSTDDEMVFFCVKPPKIVAAKDAAGHRDSYIGSDTRTDIPLRVFNFPHAKFSRVGICVYVANDCPHSEVERRRLAGVCNPNLNSWNFSLRHACDSGIRESQVCAGLKCPNSISNLNSLHSCSISLSGEAESPDEQAGPDSDKDRIDRSDPQHPPSCGFNRIGRSLHSLLGFKVTLLQLLGYLFAALAGLGGFWVFDDANGNRKRLGWLALLGGGTLSAACFTALFAAILASRA